MSLYRLVYFSSNRIDLSPVTFDTGMQEILGISRRNNASVGVTGALMFSAGHFGQVLEGPRGAVEATFERIQQDSRHGDVSLLDFKPATDRSFDGWDMAYVGRDTNTSSPWLSTTLDLSKLSSDDLLSKLHALVANENMR